MNTETGGGNFLRKVIWWTLLFVIAGVGVLISVWLTRPSTTPTPPAAPAASKPPSHTEKNSAPTIAIQNLSDDQEVKGIVKVTVAANDDTKVEKVEYSVDNTFTGVSYAKPFSFELDTTVLANGSHQLTAVAFDTQGEKGEASLNIVVANQKTAAQTGRVSSQALTSEARASGGHTSSQNSVTPSPQAPSDTHAPSVPTNLQVTADDGYTTELDWTASSDDTGVTEYAILRDATYLATTNNTNYTDQTVAPGNSYTYTVVAKDAANNASSPSNSPIITLEPSTIWHDAESPAPGNFDNAPGAIELGVKFRPLVNGTVTGVRFYKAAGSTGVHVGHLWKADGTPLGSVNFSSETTSGWQEATFSTPINVVAGSTYVVSYFAPNGGYGYSSAYFSSAGITSQYMTALQSGVDGNNGVFRNGSSGFPTSSFNNTHYWVDALFAPHKQASGPSPKLQDNSELFPGYPGSDNTGVVTGKRLPTRDRTLVVYNDNAVLDNLETTSDISVRGDNVTIRNVRVAPDGALIWGITQTTGTSGLTVEDTEIYGNGTDRLQYGIQDNGSDFTGRRIRVHTMTQAIQSNINVLIEDSYFHGQIYFDGDHTGGYLSTGGDNIILTHNNMRNPLNQTTTLGLFCDFAPVTNVTATNNLLAGGGYPVYAPPCSGSGGIKFINNKFSRALWPNGGFHGPVTSYNPLQPGNEWTGNTWFEDGTPVNP